MTDPFTGTRRGAVAGFVLALGAALVLWTPGCTPIPPGSIDVTAGPTSDQWNAQFDPVLHTPTLLRNKTIEETGLPPDAEAVSDTAAYLSVMGVVHDNPEWFRFRPGLDDFRVVNSYTQGWLRLIRLGQLYQGVQVCGAAYEARVLPNGRVGSLQGRFYPNIYLDMNTVQSAAQAATRARDLIDPGAPVPASLPRFQFENDSGLRQPILLLIVPRRDTFVLAWGVVVKANLREWVRAYVDAVTGDVIGAEFVGTTDSYYGR